LLTGPTDEERRAAAAAVEAAAAEVRSAQAKRDQLMSGATRAAQEEVRSALAGAISSEAQTRRTATDAALQVAAARTKRAETAMEQARLAVERTTLRAPYAGTITSVSLREGEFVAAGAPAFTLANLDQLQVETKDLDETATARVHEGQDVTVIVTALNRASMLGKVLRIARQPTTNSAGDVFYTATITIPQPDPNLRWGMTVRVEFR
jgi:HlyD family secretion protein